MSNVISSASKTCDRDWYIYLLFTACSLHLFVELGPIFIFPSLFSALNWETNQLSLSDLNSAYLVAIGTVILETLLVTAIFSFVKHFRKAAWYILQPLLLLVFCFLVLYYGIVVASWWSYINKGTFVRFSDLSLLRFLLDPIILFRSASREENRAVIGMFCSGVLLCGMTYLLSPRPKSVENALVHVALIIFLAAGIFSAYRVRQSSAQRFADYVQFLGTYTAPRIAFYQSSFQDETALIGDIELERLPKAESLQEYRKRIPTGWKPERSFIVFVVEALRRDVLDEPETMPEVRQLSLQGTSFPWAYATAPETAYAQSTIITGLHPLKFSTRDLFLDLEFPFFRIYDVMKTAGYRTGYFTTEWGTSIRLSESPLLDRHIDPGRIDKSQDGWLKLRGQDRSWGNESHVIDELNLKSLRNWIEEDPEKPFFSIIYLVGSHSPYVLLPEETAQGEEPGSRERYRICLRRIDRGIAELLTFLKARGIFERTEVIVTGDHGEGFGEHGIIGHPGPIIEELVHVPLVFSRNFPAGGKEKTAVSHLDIPPTILALAGLPSTPAFQGKSLFRSEQTLDLQPVFLTQQMLSREDAVIIFPYKYTWDLRRNTARLYNLEEDPRELRNLVGTLSEKEKILSENLKAFRGEQLGYYRLPLPIRSQYFAPRIRLSSELSLDP